MKNWKIAVLWSFVGLGLFLVSRSAVADGNFQPGLENSTGGNYSFPKAVPPKAGAVLVSDGGTLFNWSNSPVSTTLNAASANQLITLSSWTATMIQTSTPSAVGQLVFCANCTNSLLCISTATTAPGAGNDYVSLSTGTTTGGQKVCN